MIAEPSHRRVHDPGRETEVHALAGAKAASRGPAVNLVPGLVPGTNASVRLRKASLRLAAGTYLNN